MQIAVPPGDTFAAYTDGACSGNPGPGGYAFLIGFADGSANVQGWGSEERTTNNRMEMRALHDCLMALTPGARGTIHSDSQYVVKGMTEWRSGWTKRGRLQDGSLANSDLWALLHPLHDLLPDVRIAWVKGHADDPVNNEVDRLAVRAAAEQLPQTRMRTSLVAEIPPPGAVARIIAVQEQRLTMLRSLPAPARAAIEGIAAAFGTDELAEFLFSPIRSLGAAPIELLQTGEPEKIARLDRHIEMIAAGVYA